MARRSLLYSRFDDFHQNTRVCEDEPAGVRNKNVFVNTGDNAKGFFIQPAYFIYNLLNLKELKNNCVFLTKLSPSRILKKEI